MNQTIKNLLLVVLVSAMGVIMSCSEDVELAPVVSDQTFSIEENSSAGTVVGTIIASSDNDLSFLISSGNESGAFRLEESTGVITVLSSEELDYEVTPSFSLNVRVDDGDLTSSATITINLTDVDETTFEFLGESYEFLDGLIVDYGSEGLIPDVEDSHYNYDFVVVDSELTLVTEGDDSFYEPTGEYSIFLYAELFSPTTTEFQPGTFTYLNTDTTNPSELEGKALFDYVSVVLVDEQENQMEYLAKSGTVEVTENSDLNYTITFDVVVQLYDFDSESFSGTEQTVQYTYTGDFKFEDGGSDDDISEGVAPLSFGMK